MTEKQLNIILHKDVILQEIKDKYITYVVVIAEEWLNKGYDIRPYLDSDFNVAQMVQIGLGLEQGLDVSVYANPKYTVDQMRAKRMELQRICHK